MIYKRLGILGAISVAAVVSGVLVGCSSSSSVTPSSPTVDTTGGLTSNPGTGAPTGSSGKPQQVQVTVNGQTEQATLPPYETITSGENIAVLPSTPGTPILAGLGYGTTAAVKKVKPDAPGIQGEVFVDGHDTGITVTSGGYLSGPLILVPGYHVIIAYGPWVIVSGNVLTRSSSTSITTWSLESGSTPMVRHPCLLLSAVPFLPRVVACATATKLR